MKFPSFKRRSATPPPVQHNAAGYADRQLWNLNKLRQEVAAIGKLEGAGEYSVNFTIREYLGGIMASFNNGPKFSVYIRLAGGILSPEISIHAPTPELALEQLELEIRKRKADENEALALAAAEMDAQP